VEIAEVAEVAEPAKILFLVFQKNFFSGCLPEKVLRKHCKKRNYNKFFPAIS
jgi:hypothetical protein